MRIVNFLLAILFLVFAFVQVNDPDPVLWILDLWNHGGIQCHGNFRILSKKVYDWGTGALCAL